MIGLIKGCSSEEMMILNKEVVQGDKAFSTFMPSNHEPKIIPPKVVE